MITSNTQSTDYCFCMHTRAQQSGWVDAVAGGLGGFCLFTKPRGCKMRRTARRTSFSLPIFIMYCECKRNRFVGEVMGVWQNRRRRMHRRKVSFPFLHRNVFNNQYSMDEFNCLHIYEIVSTFPVPRFFDVI